MLAFHLIAFDIPYPANYGGAIDVFYKLKAFHACGARVILHCFEYGDRTPQAELEKYAHKVYYYKRNTSAFAKIMPFPYIVFSRMVNELANNLIAYDLPIFAEGLHCTGFFSLPKLAERRKTVRMHNVEWRYYANLAQTESNPVKRLYFQTESSRLKRFETTCLRVTDAIIPISAKENDYFAAHFPKVERRLALPFHPYEKILPLLTGVGNFALFHGNFAVSDNEKSALFLIEEVFSETDFPLVLAGRTPGNKLIKAAAKQANVKLVSNPSHDEMLQLKRAAQIHILWTMHEAGMKLKLVETLFTGRHCIANDLMTDSQESHAVIHLADNATGVLSKIEILRNKPFSEEECNRRSTFLSEKFDNIANARSLIEVIVG